MKQHILEIWQGIEKFRTEMMTRNISSAIAQMEKEGLVIDYLMTLIMTIYISAIRAVVNPYFVLQNNFSIKQAIHYTF